MCVSPRSLLEFVYPPVCAVCGTRLSLAREESGFLCLCCLDEWHQSTHSSAAAGSEEACARCGTPAEILYGDSCIACMLYPPPFRTLRSVIPYRGKAKECLTQYKYAGRRGAAPFLAEVLHQAINGDGAAPFPTRDWDVIAAVPSTLSALRRRRFSHTGLLARALGRKLILPVDLLALRSTRPRMPQAGAPLGRRLSNVSGAFRASARLRDRTVLLVDDVTTSGATITAACSAMLAAGARAVDVITLARSARFPLNRLAIHLKKRRTGLSIV